MDLEKQAIEILQTFSGDEPYQLGYSGGKDSDVILHLAKKAGVPFQAVHNLTTVDAPETVRYVRSKPEVIIEYPKMSMWQLIVKHKTPPTRLFQYCCAELKERSGIDMYAWILSCSWQSQVRKTLPFQILRKSRRNKIILCDFGLKCSERYEEKKESNYNATVDRRLYKCGLRLYLYGDRRRTAL